MIEQNLIEKLETIKALAVDGKSDGEIAEAVGISYYAIPSMRRFLGVMKPRGINILEQWKKIPESGFASFGIKWVLLELGLNPENLYRLKAIDSDKRKNTITLKIAVRE